VTLAQGVNFAGWSQFCDFNRVRFGWIDNLLSNSIGICIAV